MPSLFSRISTGTVVIEPFTGSGKQPSPKALKILKNPSVDPTTNFHTDCLTPNFLKYSKFSSARIGNGALCILVLFVKNPKEY